MWLVVMPSSHRFAKDESERTDLSKVPLTLLMLSWVSLFCPSRLIDIELAPASLISFNFEDVRNFETAGDTAKFTPIL